MVIAIAGCGGAKATARVVVVTPSPTPSATATATPTQAPTATPTTAATPTATAAATSNSTPGPGGPPDVCTGNPNDTASDAKDKAYFADGAKDLPFDVYCAVLPSSWWLSMTDYKVPDGGKMTITYRNASGGLITVGEGNFCAGAPDCWTSTSDLGAGSFGPLAGSLKLRAAGQYAVYVDAGTTHGYQIVGQGMSQNVFAAYAAAMHKVARS
jgi:hypothetical protein